ncbi:MAG: ketoacyl-ACP synthase III [candidate division KSB1 bacterium]|nr:ketoacyl-ACP synthase III [candidate division KSB1 bacterium]
MRRSRIRATGMYVPPRIVPNAELAPLVGTTEEWIVERTGIHQRHWAEEGIGASDLAVEACRQALERAALSPAEIDLVVFATLSPDYPIPGSGPLLQAKLGLPPIPTVDIRNQCSGFVYGLAVADQFIRTGACTKALVVGAEVQSSGLDLTPRGRDMAVLFGDGAGAVVLEATQEERGILGFALHTDGTHAFDLWLEDPGSRKNPRLTHEMIDRGSIYPKMNGREVFRQAVLRFPEVIEEALANCGLSVKDVDLVVPHQANQRITDAVAERLGLVGRVYSNIARYGNTTAASIPIALHEAVVEGKIQDGNIVVLASFGAGFSWGAVVIRW